MLSDFNECIVKARQKPEYKQGDFLDSIEQLDYRVEDAGHTFHRLRNGRRSVVGWTLRSQMMTG